jgi:hypothetical protein
MHIISTCLRELVAHDVGELVERLHGADRCELRHYTSEITIRHNVVMMTQQAHLCA